MLDALSFQAAGLFLAIVVIGLAIIRWLKSNIDYSRATAWEKEKHRK
jgi:hypothetical protein